MGLGFWMCFVLVPCFVVFGLLFAVLKEKVGSLSSLFLTPYAAVLAYVVWGILFFKNVHLDAHKAFEKYLYKQ